ncbi:uncharacterized protein ColSpa_00444 [Colletotrichum spaethianum]|uniref:Uncharacterized protein n=1 Tax=Colletotrichum spaethianum TaxID=700344 RepID=A0AA37L616_9PEZI|nr:uncharacterized protein ColSpa_00444 [Colletotrichum spaethianum]GKT40263.1 hypothetical protein ColSpa_00444 [Colletotrichum spaethianum]
MQIPVHDDLWVEMDARKLREREMRAYFIPHATEDNVYFAIMPRGTAFVDEFQTSWDRFLENPLKLLFWGLNPSRPVNKKESSPADEKTEKPKSPFDKEEDRQPLAAW